MIPLHEDVSPRYDDPIVLRLITQIHESQVELDRKLSAHMTNETQELAEAITKLMADAFPEGDPGGHRRHHELVMQQAEEKAEFWRSMRKEVGKWGLLGVLGFLVAAAWRSFLMGPLK